MDCFATPLAVERARHVTAAHALGCLAIDSDGFAAVIAPYGSLVSGGGARCF